MSDNVRGVLWALLANGLFACTLALSKLLVEDYHILQILFFRQLAVFLSTVPALVQNFPLAMMTKNPGLNFIRLLGAFTALFCGVWGAAILPLTTSITFGFVMVFFVALLAMLTLGESVGKHRLLVIVTGFIGVLIVMRPGVDGLIDIRGFVPIAGAFGAAVAIVCVRRLSQTESTATLLIYQSTFVGLVTAIPLYWVWVTPDVFDWMLLALLGVLASAAQWFGIKSLRYGEASIIGNIEYMKLIYGAIFGYLIFAEVPDGYTIIGAGVIIASALYLLYRERLKNRQDMQA